MPVEGMPDRKLHRLCWTCQRWFHPHEGILDFPPARGPISYLLSKSARLMEDESRRKFFCTPCHDKAMARATSNRAAMRWLIISVVIVVVVGGVAWHTGFIQDLLRP